MPEALKNAGLIQGLQAKYAGRVDVPPYNSTRDKATLLLNPHSIKAFSLRLAEKVTDVRRKGQFPVVLGGDCSILIGCMVALRRLGPYSLFFIDGHADFYQPEAEPNGEVASMELARGKEMLLATKFPPGTDRGGSVPASLPLPVGLHYKTDGVDS